MPACGPVREVAATPLSCRAIARSATDWSSPVESSWSISRGEGSRLTSHASRSSLSVCLPIAETVTARLRPESWTLFTLSATALMCSAVATELPPYFWTMIPKDVSTLLLDRYQASGYRLQVGTARAPSGSDIQQNLTAGACNLRPAVGAAHLRQRLSSCYAQGLAVDIAGLLGGEEDEGGGELYRLGRAAHGGGAAELRYGVAWHGGGDDRGPHRTRRHRIRPQPVLHDLLGETLGEGDDGALRARVGEQRRGRLVGLNRGYVDDGAAFWHVRERGLDQPEHRVDVGLEGTVEQLGRDVGYPFDGHLVGRVVDEDIYLAELVDGPLDELFAVGLIGHVSRHLYGLAARVFDGLRRLCGVRLFHFEVGDHHVGTLAGEGERDGPSDARVTARDDCLLAFELAAALVGLDAVVRPGLHLLLQAGVLVPLVLFGILGLRILLRRVLLGVLILCHPNRPSGSLTRVLRSFALFLTASNREGACRRPAPDLEKADNMGCRKVKTLRRGRRLWESSGSSFRTSRWT